MYTNRQTHRLSVCGLTGAPFRSLCHVNLDCVNRGGWEAALKPKETAAGTCNDSTKEPTSPSTNLQHLLQLQDYTQHGKVATSSLLHKRWDFPPNSASRWRSLFIIRERFCPKVRKKRKCSNIIQNKIFYYFISVSILIFCLSCFRSSNFSHTSACPLFVLLLLCEYYLASSNLTCIYSD